MWSILRCACAVTESSRLPGWVRVFWRYTYNANASRRFYFLGQWTLNAFFDISEMYIQEISLSFLWGCYAHGVGIDFRRVCYHHVNIFYAVLSLCRVSTVKHIHKLSCDADKWVGSYPLEQHPYNQLQHPSPRGRWRRFRRNIENTWSFLLASSRRWEVVHFSRTCVLKLACLRVRLFVVREPRCRRGCFICF